MTRKWCEKLTDRKKGRNKGAEEGSLYATGLRSSCEEQLYFTMRIAIPCIKTYLQKVRVREPWWY